ncbi:peptidoglycan recognition protein-like [Glandiceps talaboti]
MGLTKLTLLACVFVYFVNGDSQCTTQGGICQYDQNDCSGWYVSGQCSGPVNRRCCLPAGDDSACETLIGQCQDVSMSCDGSYSSGLCSGPTERKCCVPEDENAAYCGDVRVVSRNEWGARTPSQKSNMMVPVAYTFIHHTVSSTCHAIETCKSVVRGVQNNHMDTKGWNDIGYSFLIGQDGNAYEGRGWGVQGAHTYGYNNRAHGISFIGNFDNQLPNQLAINATKALIKCGVDRGYIKENYSLLGHRDVASTACPGNALYDDIKSWENYE